MKSAGTSPRSSTTSAADSALERIGGTVKQAAENAVATLAIYAFRLILRVFYAWRIEAINESVIRDNLDRSVLLVANHTSHLDFILLNALFKQRYGSSITFLAKKELWESPVWRLLIRYGNAIPVDRAQLSIGTIRAMKGMLASRRFLGMFPEGTRSADGRMGPIKPGLEFILRMHPDLVVVPCGLQGFHEAWPKSKALQLFLPVKHKLSISFGAAQTFSARQSPGEFVTQLMEEVARQAGQRIPASPASGEQQQSEQEHLAA